MESATGARRYEDGTYLTIPAARARFGLREAEILALVRGKRVRVRREPIVGALRGLFRTFVREEDLRRLSH
ncbi:MAG: hypothetical protein K8I02_10830 [Candidatus Methylomirabilis sp.]|nr:hypothetical protein [Deltaproteobacteria bacterium]